MSEIKKALGRKSRQLGRENRARVFLAIYEKPLTFSELLTTIDLSRASLTQHLKTLQKAGIIKKAISNGNVVYEVASKEKGKDEIKGFFYFLFGFIFGFLSVKSKKLLEQAVEEAMKKPSELQIEEVK